MLVTCRKVSDFSSFGEDRHRKDKGLYECSLVRNQSILQLAVHDINKVAEEVCKKTASELKVVSF